MITIDILGTPSPKGSGRAVLVGGRARYLSGGSGPGAARMRSWESAVREAARAVVGEVDAPAFVAVPLAVRLSFALARPAGHWGKRGLRPAAPIAPASKPDLDKLVRSTLDALTGCVWDDDSRIVSIQALKVWAQPGAEGARVEVWQWP